MVIVKLDFIQWKRTRDTVIRNRFGISNSRASHVTLFFFLFLIYTFYLFLIGGNILRKYAGYTEFSNPDTASSNFETTRKFISIGY